MIILKINIAEIVKAPREVVNAEVVLQQVKGKTTKQSGKLSINSQNYPGFRQFCFSLPVIETYNLLKSKQ